MDKIVLDVGGMRCGGCENVLRQALSACPGIRQVNPDHRQNKVEIEYDAARIDLPQIRKVITDKGYTLNG